MANSTITPVKGKPYKIFKGYDPQDSTKKLWDKISFWTHADDVDIDVKDGQGQVTDTQTLQEFADGITDIVQDMTGATSSTDGVHGLVPAPEAGDERKVLSGAGTWIDHDAGFQFDTIAEMEAALSNIPEDSTVFVGEESPTAVDGDVALSDTSENWVKNKVVSRTIGKLTQLTTTATTNLVAAINELRGKFDANYLLPLTAGGTGASTALAARKKLEANGSGNIAVTEATRTMSAQRAAGSYVYVTADDQLYVITTTIASGGTLTPGTNATAKNVGEVLQTLNSDLTDINNKFNYYNANTDRTVDANRKTALDYLLNNYGAGIYSVRYSGGYYYMYMLTKTTVPTNDAFAVEFTYVGNINLFRHEAGAWSIANIV